MPEYAQKTGNAPSRVNPARPSRTPASRLTSSSSPDSGPSPAQRMQAARIAQLTRALNQSPRVAHVAQLSTALQEKPHEIVQGRFETVQRAGVEEEELLQGKFNPVQRAAVEDEQLLQGKFEVAQCAPAERGPQAAQNQTGMPDHLKAGIESLSGMDLSDVRVHANSDRPARLDALAYAQGSDIHVAPGQDQHLPHEAWHVVQQRQGRVVPTMQMQGVSINDDHGLEAEADRMGAQASQLKRDATCDRSRA